MNMNIENFKEEHFALYQIWHRGATTYIYSKCSNLVTPQLSLYGVFHKKSPCFGNSNMEPITPNTVFGPVFERAKYGQVRYP